MAKIFEKEINELLKFGKPKIAFGLKNIPEKKVIDNLKKCKEYADIVLVGPDEIEKIEGFERVLTENPELTIVKLLVDKKIDGLVRGKIDDAFMKDHYKELTGKKFSICFVLMEDPFGRRYFLGPSSNWEGYTKEDRLRIAREFIAFFKEWKIEPKVAVFSTIRHDVYKAKKDIREGLVGKLNNDYENAEWIVKNLKNENVNVEHYAINLKEAIEDGCNLLVPHDGVVGNQLFRMLLACGGNVLTATFFGLPHFWEDNSRTENDFIFHFKWLSALINKKKIEEKEEK